MKMTVTNKQVEKWLEEMIPGLAKDIAQYGWDNQGYSEFGQCYECDERAFEKFCEEDGLDPEEADYWDVLGDHEGEMVSMMAGYMEERLWEEADVKAIGKAARKAQREASGDDEVGFGYNYDMHMKDSIGRDNGPIGWQVKREDFGGAYTYYEC